MNKLLTMLIRESANAAIRLLAFGGTALADASPSCRLASSPSESFLSAMLNPSQE